MVNKVIKETLKETILKLINNLDLLEVFGKNIVICLKKGNLWEDRVNTIEKELIMYKKPKG